MRRIVDPGSIPGFTTRRRNRTRYRLFGLLDYDNDKRCAEHDHEEWHTDWHLCENGFEPGQKKMGPVLKAQAPWLQHLED